MDDIEKQELIRKLADSRESINLLQNMLKKEQSNVEHELRLATEAKHGLNDVLFGLTGNSFYKNT
jgi:hypothetical protein